MKNSTDMADFAEYIAKALGTDPDVEVREPLKKKTTEVRCTYYSPVSAMLEAFGQLNEQEDAEAYLLSMVPRQAC